MECPTALRGSHGSLFGIHFLAVVQRNPDVLQFRLQEITVSGSGSPSTSTVRDQAAPSPSIGGQPACVFVRGDSKGEPTLERQNRTVRLRIGLGVGSDMNGFAMRM